MFQIIFYDDYNEVKYSELFNTKALAENFAISCEYDYQDIVIDDNGNDYWKTFYRYINPDNKETYIGYTIEIV